MDRNYWEQAAKKEYGQLIFDVLGNKGSANIITAIQQLAGAKKTVADIGCAVGRWLPLLAPAFNNVYAVDISAKYLQTAQKNNGQYSNIKYVRADFAKSKKNVPACDVVVSINAILMPDAKLRHSYFKNIAAVLKKKGHLLLVCPALESALFSQYIFNHWNSATGKFEPARTENTANSKNVFDGLIQLDGTYTKHYLKEELQFVLNTYGLQMLQVQKVEYQWQTEFTEPPRWLREPLPWDWLVVAQKH